MQVRALEAGHVSGRAVVLFLLEHGLLDEVELHLDLFRGGYSFADVVEGVERILAAAYAEEPARGLGDEPDRREEEDWGSDLDDNCCVSAMSATARYCRPLRRLSGEDGGEVLHLRVIYAHFPSKCVVDAYTVADARTPPTYNQL